VGFCELAASEVGRAKGREEMTIPIRDPAFAGLIDRRPCSPGPISRILRSAWRAPEKVLFLKMEQF
jgi:hypothetical protein